MTVLAVRLGRGRTGGTTGLDWLIQRASKAGRDIIVADGDKRNATLSRLYNGKGMHPPSDEVADVKDWISTVLDKMAMAEASVALDLGGGDRVLQEYGRDLELVEFCNHIGASALALYFLGPEQDDLDHAFALFESEVFRPDHTIIVLNEGLVSTNQKTLRVAFDRTLESKQLGSMCESGARVIVMPRLACLDRVRNLGLGLNKAAAGDKTLGPTFSFMVRQWLLRMEEECAQTNILEWLP